MKKERLTKTLGIAIVVLFIVITIVPDIWALDKETDEYDELKDNNDIKVIDEYEEIITFIIGYAKINWIERRGLFRGEVNLTWEYYPRGYINLSGFRRSESSIKYYNEIVTVPVGFIYAYRFIGFNTANLWMDPTPTVNGIALGNIIWS